MAREQDESRIPLNPWLQAGGLAFQALYVAAILAALTWLFSNCREIPPANRALVIRLGAQQRVASAGLLLAWPRPFEEVVLLPASEAILEEDMPLEKPQSLLNDIRPSSYDEAVTQSEAPLTPAMSDAQASLGNRLTGDASVVAMDAKVFYTVAEPYEYVLQRSHVAAALDRLVSRSIVSVCASRDLDSIMVARPELLAVANEAAEQRERLRGEVMQKINHYLTELHREGTGLGIEVRRVDVAAALHPDTLDAFQSVLTATQDELQELANARTERERSLQAAREDADRTIEVAQARASERVSKAQADTADVQQLAGAIKSGADPGLLARIYRERVQAILAKTQALTLVNPRDDAHLIVPGASSR